MLAGPAFSRARLGFETTQRGQRRPGERSMLIRLMGYTRSLLSQRSYRLTLRRAVVIVPHSSGPARVFLTRENRP